MLLVILDVFFVLISNLPGPKPYLLRKIWDSWEKLIRATKPPFVTDHLTELPTDWSFHKDASALTGRIIKKVLIIIMIMTLYVTKIR